jgi:hypothetical protein
MPRPCLHHLPTLRGYAEETDQNTIGLAGRLRSLQ